MRSKRLKIRDRRGFLLFEVIITIGIITAGLLFVMRAYSTSKGSIERSTDLFKTSLLLEEKIFEFEERGMMEEGSKEGKFEEEKDHPWKKDYSWKAVAQPISDDSDILHVTLDVFQTKSPQTTAYSLTTYIDKKK